MAVQVPAWSENVALLNLENELARARARVLRRWLIAYLVY